MLSFTHDFKIPFFFFSEIGFLRETVLAVTRLALSSQRCLPLLPECWVKVCVITARLTLKFSQIQSFLLQLLIFFKNPS